MEQKVKQVIDSYINHHACVPDTCKWLRPLLLNVACTTWCFIHKSLPSSYTMYNENLYVDDKDNDDGRMFYIEDSVDTVNSTALHHVALLSKKYSPHTTFNVRNKTHHTSVVIHLKDDTKIIPLRYSRQQHDTNCQNLSSYQMDSDDLHTHKTHDLNIASPTNSSTTLPNVNKRFSRLLSLSRSRQVNHESASRIPVHTLVCEPLMNSFQHKHHVMMQTWKNTYAHLFKYWLFSVHPSYQFTHDDNQKNHILMFRLSLHFKNYIHMYCIQQDSLGHYIYNFIDDDKKNLYLIPDWPMRICENLFISHQQELYSQSNVSQSLDQKQHSRLFVHHLSIYPLFYFDELLINDHQNHPTNNHSHHSNNNDDHIFNVLKCAKTNSCLSHQSNDGLSNIHFWHQSFLKKIPDQLGLYALDLSLIQSFLNQKQLNVIYEYWWLTKAVFGVHVNQWHALEHCIRTNHANSSNSDALLKHVIDIANTDTKSHWPFCVRKQISGKFCKYDALDKSADAEFVFEDPIQVIDYLLNVLDPIKSLPSLRAHTRCNKCGSDKLDINIKQTRSSDESSTIFYSCQQCSNTWKD